MFRSFRWTLLQLNTISSGIDDWVPSGRSWHTLSLIDDYHGLLYGGYERNSQPLGDCWLVDLRPLINSTPVTRWTRLRHLETGNRLWHCSVALPAGQVYLVRLANNYILSLSVFLCYK